MRTLLIFLVVLAAAVALTLTLIEHPGYVLIAQTPWSIEMPLTVFVILVAVAGILFAGLWRGLVQLWNTPREVEHARLRRRRRRAEEALHRALEYLAEGRHAHAEKAFAVGLNQAESPVLHALGAAEAAQQQGAMDRRDDYLAQAARVAPKAWLATGIAQARLQYQAGQYEHALATLTDLRTRAPDEPGIHRLLARAYQALCDWPSLARLADDLRRVGAFGEAEIQALEEEAHRELLSLPLPPGSRPVLDQAWDALPEGLKRRVSLIAIYARQLVRLGEHDVAESLTGEALDHLWSETLAHVYGETEPSAPERQASRIETWLDRHPDSPGMLLAAARVAMRMKQTARARALLKTAATHIESAHDWTVHGELLHALNDPPAALESYRRAIAGLSEEARATALTTGANPAPAADYGY